jgi:glutamate synthase (NADPH/NADH) small chain
MDCIRTSIRLGASKVTGVYRRNEKSMPGSKREYQNACEEGSEFIFNAQPVGLIIKDEKLHTVKFVKTEQVTNSDGKTSLEHIAGSEFEIEADVVITAFGFKPEQYQWLNQHQVQTDHHGRIRVQKERLQTANPKIFAGGDIVRGASLVVHAIADGIAAAREIKEFIEGN